MSATEDLLARIVAAKRREVAAAQDRFPLAEIQQRLADAPPVRDFAAVLGTPGPIRAIAEVKKASPSLGVIRPDFNPVDIATRYQRHGASALSVLTDRPFFQGDLSDLARVRFIAGVPVLRKDFIIDPYQVYEARFIGADAILLIAEIVTDEQLEQLGRIAADLGMAALVELYDPDNLDRVLRGGARLVGINNRNLRTFQTDLHHTLDLIDRVPDDCCLVSESGIRTRAEVERLEAAGVDAILVGETLMRAADPGAMLASLLGLAADEEPRIEERGD